MQYVTEWTLPDKFGGMFANQCIRPTRAQADNAARNQVAKTRNYHRIRGGIRAIYDRYEMDDNGKVVTS